MVECKSSPLISIITVTYNAEGSIEKTLKSVGQCETDKIEHLIIDGGSTDKTLKIVTNYTSQSKICISEPDNGIYDAMNKALAYATGRWILYLNAGDEIFGKLEIDSLIDRLQNCCDSSLVYTNYVETGAGIERLIKVPKEIKRADLVQGMPICHQAMVVNRKNFLAFNTSYKLSADYDQLLRYYYSGGVITFIDLTFSNFDVTGITSRARTATIKERRTIFRNYDKLTLFEEFKICIKIVESYVFQIFLKAGLIPYYRFLKFRLLRL